MVSEIADIFVWGHLYLWKDVMYDCITTIICSSNNKYLISFSFWIKLRVSSPNFQQKHHQLVCFKGRCCHVFKHPGVDVMKEPNRQLSVCESRLNPCSFECFEYSAVLKIRTGPGDNGLPNLTQNKNNQTQNQWTRVIKFGWYSFVCIVINLRTQLGFNTYCSSNKTISINFKENHSREEGLEKGFWGWKETRHQHCCHRYDHYHRRMHCCQTCRQFETTQNFHNKVWKKLTCGFDTYFSEQHCRITFSDHTFWESSSFWNRHSHDSGPGAVEISTWNRLNKWPE